MDKIICDVCGTSYPETASQCPICGYVKQKGTKASASEEGAGSYVYVKGGRFSSANVRKRNLESGITPAEGSDGKGRKSGSNMVLGIVAIVLLLALIAALVFFIMKIIDQRNVSEEAKSTLQTTQATELAAKPGPCQELHTDKAQVTLSQAGAMWQIHTTTVPEETTDSLTYTVLDSAVATVDETGTVTAVSQGQTAVTVQCGSATLIVTVVCDFGEEEGDWGLNRSDVSLFAVGESWDLYSSSSTVPKNKITWTSDDETVATVDGGIVTAVSKGTTTVHGEYNGVTYSCTVRCKIEDGTSEEEGGEEGTSGETTVDTSSLSISHTDVSISVGETFNLRLKDASGNAAKVTWEASRNGYVNIDGNSITGLKSTENDYVTVRTTYNGTTYECIVRVK